MALDPIALRAANALLYEAHLELEGRRLTNGPEDAALRREWMDYYESIASPPPPGEPDEEPEKSEEALAEEAAYPIKGCEELCKDDSGATCKCCDQTTITFYVQKEKSAVGVAWNYISGADNMETGHTFIAVGDGTLKDKSAYGFYPASSWTGETGGINTNEGFYVPGEDEPNTSVYLPENRHAYTHFKSFKACPSKVAEMETAIEKEIEAIKSNSDDAPKYHLAGLQCTTWAQKHLETLGFSAPTSMSPYGAAEEIEEEEKPDEEDKKGPFR